MNEPGSITVILADDHAIVREGIASLLRSKPDFNVVGECSDGFAAVELILSLRPQIAIVDLQMPKLHGVEVIRKVRDANCATKIIVLSINRDRHIVEEAFRSGANGYVLKEGPSRHLVDAINYIHDGGRYVTPLLGQIVSNRDAQEPEDAIDSLSPREQAVFGFLADGMRPKNIAALMNISPKTVDTYRSNIMRKLNIDGIAGLVKFAIQRNLTPMGYERGKISAVSSNSAQFQGGDMVWPGTLGAPPSSASRLSSRPI